jgi:hypothetical protein
LPVKSRRRSRQRSRKPRLRVAARFHCANLGRAIRVGLTAFGAMTGRELADWCYVGVRPSQRARIGARWTATLSGRSAVRRALARLKRRGEVVVAGKLGRFNLYQRGHRR